MLYIFKNRYYCTDVYHHVYDEMVRRGYKCVQIVDEDTNYNLNDYLGDKVTLITSDHIMDRYNDRENSSVKDFEKILKPVKKIYAMHDLNIHKLNDPVDEYEVMLPSDDWRLLFEGKCKKIHITGHPKFLSKTRTNEYKGIFFVSLIYIYAERGPEYFYNHFKPIFDLKIPFKFPKFKPIEKLLPIVEKKGIEIIDPNKESFDYLHECEVAISNSASSIVIEAAMAGCGVINIGFRSEPQTIYGQFNILHTNDNPNITLESAPKNKVYEHMKLDMDKAIDVITRHDE